jgi:hypothetical protein
MAQLRAPARPVLRPPALLPAAVPLLPLLPLVVSGVAVLVLV